MAKYRVIIHETIVYELEVEADDEDSAADAAIDLWHKNDNNDPFITETLDPKVRGVDEV